MSFNYFPLIKTRDAELRCMRSLSSETLRRILPIYELTKSRKTKTAPEGNIYKRMEEIRSIQKDNPFILDLSLNPKYINSKIEQLMSPEYGFKEWQEFLNFFPELNIIPMVHLYEDSEDSLKETLQFVKDMSIKKDLAIRLPYNLPQGNYTYYLDPITKVLQNDHKLIVILDADYIRNEAKNNIKKVADNFIFAIKEIKKLSKIKYIIMVSTTFPRNPAHEGKNDEMGEFNIYEEEIYRCVREKVDVKYGDYVSINTEQIEIKGGGFVPRIDIALENSFFYKRYRQKDGGYERCAKKILQDERYNNLFCWADEEIKKASLDNATGLSPAFWISVRMVYYIQSRIKLRNDY